MYIYERKGWPHFQWDQAGLAGLLAQVRHHQGHLLGRMEALGFDLCEEATLQTLTQDVVKSSEIEGEKLDVAQVRSSIAKHLGLEVGGVQTVDRSVEGIVEITLDATRNYQLPLTQKRLFAWHAALFPTGRSGMQHIQVGAWRSKASGAMQVVSGAYGHEKIHYEAPAYGRLKKEMSLFLKCFKSPLKTDSVIHSALSHFWFVTIHPFEDGNGRIARAIADMMLARSEKSRQRFYSMSSQIQKERRIYYEVLESCQKGTLDITPWIEWFLNCLQRALNASSKILETVLFKSRFWEVHKNEFFNHRQHAVMNRLLDGFEGKMTSSKWAKLTKCSQDTALRDIQDLLARKILIKQEAGGRSTSYEVRPVN